MCLSAITGYHSVQGELKWLQRKEHCGYGKVQNSILTLSVALKMENSALEARTEEQSKAECVDLA